MNSMKDATSNETKIVSIDSRRKDPRVIGEAFCLSCRHEWVAVAPVGVETPFECPSCNRFSGRLKYEIDPPSDVLYTCGVCDNQLVNIMPGGDIFCPSCGNTSNIMDIVGT